MFSKSDQRKLSVFLTCLSIAVLAWLFFALSNKYVYTVMTNVNFVSFPNNKAFHPLQSDTVNLQIQGTGWQLVFDRVRLQPRSIKVNLSRLDTRDYITFNEQLKDINLQFHSDQRVISVDPDTLYFDFSARSVKRVPVRLAYKVGFSRQFGLSGPVWINPAYVMVTGPKDELAKISYWKTDSIMLQRVAAPVARKVALQPASQPNINVYPLVVDVRIPVGEFTERTEEVPIRLLNYRSSKVKLLPEKVKITYLTALSNFPQSGKDSFRATVDLDNWLKSGFQQLPVRLGQVPPFSKVIRIEPQAVDFIVKD